MIAVELVKNRLAELGLTQKDVAVAWNVAQPTANQKLNRVRPIDLDEAETLFSLLELDDSQFGAYFFAK